MSVTLESALQTARRYSVFVEQMLNRFPDMLSEQDLRALKPGEMHALAASALAQVVDEEAMKTALRQFRRHQMVRMAVRDLSGVGTLDETLADASDLADALVGLTYRWVYDRLALRWGQPMGEHSGQAQELIILGMGKLGGQELNYSSDIDLIFVYPEKGMTQGGERSVTNEEFFVKVGQQMNALLTATTADGIVFRVDMRLRPFGTAGQLAHSFDGFEQYYQLHGRPWERYAMVKARAMTGKAEDIAELQALLRPFVYRRYVDFSMLESLRELKRMIALEVHKKGSERNVKLGPGGIREVEFIAQAFQLVHGGRDLPLQGRQLLPTLSLLGERHYLDDEAVSALQTAYRFLRNVENRLQMWADQQTHLLPDDAARMALLAESMGFAGVDDFMAQLNQHRASVQSHFDAVLGVPVEPGENGWEGLWADPEQAALSEPLAEEAEWRNQLAAFVGGRTVGTMSAEARARLDAVMPLLLAEAAAQGGSVETLKRVLQVVRAVLKRSAYLVLLRESSQARRHLVQLCAVSPWLADYLVQMPSLLDQLLDARLLFSPLSRQALAEELAHQLADVDDEERLMDVLRRFKHAQVFRVAASDLTGQLPLMKVSDYLTWIAEAVVEAALGKVWAMLTARHGLPGGWQGEGMPFVVVGFGKLGGLELGYGSDLDMVYLYDDALSQSDMTDGERPLENALFFTRVGQKLTTLLNTQTVAGMAYEVDTRLRPHGASGSLVPSLAAFFRYEEEQAWTWEHQALIRTRAIAGHPALMARFETFRRDFLCRARDADKLKEEVLAMREKMRAHLDKSTAELFDLKHGRGGMVDIEFLVQYLVLRQAADHPAVAHYSDNIRQMEALGAAGVLSAQETRLLTDAYRGYRALGHRQALAKQSAQVAPAEVAQWSEPVSGVWQQVFA